MEWSYDPDPEDSVFQSDFAIVLREGASSCCVNETHRYGLFSEADWTQWLTSAGFEVTLARDDIKHEVFVAARPR